MDLPEQKATVIHEIAHAIAGYEAGHNHVWRMVDERLGGNGKRTHNNMKNRDNARWQGSCECGRTIGYFRKPKGDRVFRECKHRITWVDTLQKDA